jgi:hypothetical protein
MLPGHTKALPVSTEWAAFFGLSLGAEFWLAKFIPPAVNKVTARQPGSRHYPPVGTLHIRINEAPARTSP